MQFDNQQNLTDILSQHIDVESDLIVDEFSEVVNSGDLQNIDFGKEDRYAYRLGQLAFFLPDDELSEVLENVEYAYIPKMPENVLGLCNVRGNLVPVFDMHGFLDVKRTHKQKNLLCIGAGDDMVGVLLDQMPFRVKSSECKALTSTPLLPPAVQPYVSQVYMNDSQVYLDYRHEDFFESLFN